MKCLFIIDVQNGFISNATRFILPAIEQLMNDFKGEFILATKFVNRDGSGFTDIMHWNGLKTARETDLIPFVKETASYIVEKHSYSACTAKAMRILKKHAVSEVYIAGIDTDCCVLSTAISLFEHNIRPIVLEKYCASNGGETSHIAAIRVLERCIGARQIFTGTYIP